MGGDESPDSDSGRMDESSVRRSLETLCQELNMDEQTATEAMENFTAMWNTYTLEVYLLIYIHFIYFYIYKSENMFIYLEYKCTVCSYCLFTLPTCQGEALIDMHTQSYQAWRLPWLRALTSVD
jgi:hypothetical protein